LKRINLLPHSGAIKCIFFMFSRQVLMWTWMVSGATIVFFFFLKKRITISIVAIAVVHKPDSTARTFDPIVSGTGQPTRSLTPEQCINRERVYNPTQKHGVALASSLPRTVSRWQSTMRTVSELGTENKIFSNLFLNHA